MRRVASCAARPQPLPALPPLLQAHAGVPAEGHEGGGAPAAPPPAVLRPLYGATLALSMLLLLKEYIKAAYSVNSERIEAFATGGCRRRGGRRVPGSNDTFPLYPAPWPHVCSTTCVPRPTTIARSGREAQAEEKVVVAPLAGVPTHLDKLDLEAPCGLDKARAQYKVGCAGERERERSWEGAGGASRGQTHRPPLWPVPSAPPCPTPASASTRSSSSS